MSGVTIQPVEMALDAAVLIMQNGGSTLAAAETFGKILAGARVEGVASIWRLDFIAASFEGRQSTVVRPVGPIGVNLVRAGELTALGERVATGEITPAAFGAELERIRSLPAPYNRWVMVAAAACTAAFFSQIPGGDWGSLAIAFAAAGIGQFFRSVLQARRAPVARITLICGSISAAIACLGLRLGFSDIQPATLIASIIYLVPGLPLINGFVDVLSHKYLIVGVQRIVNAIYLFLILAIAIGMASALIV